MFEVFYTGKRTRWDGVLVLASVEDEAGKVRAQTALPWRCDVVNHSPTGLEWGYAGSGPSQLALAILCDLFGHAGLPECDGRAAWLHQQFKADCLVNLPRWGWRLHEDEVIEWCLCQEDEVVSSSLEAYQYSVALRR